MDRNFLFLSAFCFLVFAFIAYLYVPDTSDFFFHLCKSGYCVEDIGSFYTVHSFSVYRPLVSWISFPFAFSLESFRLFWLYLFLFFPFFFYFVSRRNPFSFLLVFCIPFLFVSWFASLFAQLLMSFFWLVQVRLLLDSFFSVRRLWLLSFCFALMFLSHSFGAYLFLITFFVWLCHLFFSSFFEVVSGNWSFTVLLPSRLLSDVPFHVLFFKFLSFPLLFFVRVFDFRFFLFLFMLLVSFFSGTLASRILFVSSLLLAWLVADSLASLLVGKRFYWIVFFVLLSEFVFQLIF